ncbi:MAG: DUF1269 domain-containing protein [Pseudomonadota bacterium]
MRRLYFVLPDQETTRQVVNELEEKDIPHHHLHTIAGYAQSLEDLPEATVWQKTELAHGIELGVGLGGAAGLFGGILAVAFPPAGLVLGGGAVLVSAAAGAGFGGVVSALMSSHDHNHDLDRFNDAIADGGILLLVDIPKERVDEISKAIRQHHPEAEISLAHPKPA